MARIGNAISLVKAHSIVVPRFADLPLSLHLITRDVPLYHATEEEIERCMPSPYWGFVWPGGFGVSRYIRENPHVVRGKRVLDFGSGSSVVGITAAQVGSKSVICNDIDEVSIAASTLNAELNGVSGLVQFTASNLVGLDVSKSVDVILAGDVAYDKEMAAPVLRWLRQHAAANTRVFVGCPGRNYLNMAHMVERASYPIHPDLIENASSGFASTKVFEIVDS